MGAPKSPRDMINTIIANMKEKTGRSLEEWGAIAKKGGPWTARELRSWLKAEHGLGHVAAGIVADSALGLDRYAAYDDPDALLDALFSGANEPLRPLYDRLVRAGQKLGKDVRVVVCKTYVGLSRTRQFAVLKPMARKRIDLGLALPGAEVSGRLESARGLGTSDRITHRVRVHSLEEADAEVATLLRLAYEQDV